MRSKLPHVALATMLALGGAAAAAQGASAPRMGMGGMHGWRMGPENTPGWSLMSPAERQAHHDRMAAMTDHAACSAYMAEHHDRMSARARERGVSAPGRPRHDACAPLKPKS